MFTYEDLTEANNTGVTKEFILSAINEHKLSRLYKEGSVAYEYFCRRNVTISEYQKLLYTISGEAVPDNYSANYKFRNGFFTSFVRQEVSYLLGNGITFNNSETKEKLGDNDFDVEVRKAAKAALWGGVSFGFWNLDHLDVFTIKEFIPLIGESDGALHAGIRFWQIDSGKPLRATLYEEDGYTEFIWTIDKNNQLSEGQILQDKRQYVQIVASTPADGVEILDGMNYPGFPIVPLWGNEEHQSEFIGLREKIDGYDLIQSGFANDLDDASQIYWTINNAGGMDDIDLVKFVERMKTVKAAVMDEEGATAEAHTLEVPYNARVEMLKDLRDSLYRDAMALDSDKLTGGNTSIPAIEASYENLNLKCDDFETCVTEFINAILKLVGIDDMPSYKRSKIINAAESTTMVLAAAQYLDDETILKHLPFLSPDEIDDVLERKEEEESERYEYGQGEEVDGQGTVENGEGVEEGVPSGRKGTQEEVG